tara:strand:+ start:1668 stop:2192 length:525 start_codon:yes stop_codon:yes gene_type:complete
MDSNDKVQHLFNQCVKEQVLVIVSKIANDNGLNYVEMVEKYGLTNEEKQNYKPKSKRQIKIPDQCVRCEAMTNGETQCKRSHKDGTKFCRRHKYKQVYGTIHNNLVLCKPILEEDIPNREEELEIEYNGNLITLEDGTEVIYIPSTGLCTTYSLEPKILGKLSSDFKYIIKDED